MIYGVRDVGSSDDELFMIGGGIVEEDAVHKEQVFCRIYDFDAQNYDVAG